MSSKIAILTGFAAAMGGSLPPIEQRFPTADSDPLKRLRHMARVQGFSGDKAVEEAARRAQGSNRSILETAAEVAEEIFNGSYEEKS